MTDLDDAIREMEEAVWSSVQEHVGGGEPEPEPPAPPAAVSRPAPETVFRIPVTPDSPEPERQPTPEPTKVEPSAVAAPTFQIPLVREQPGLEAEAPVAESETAFRVPLAPAAPESPVPAPASEPVAATFQIPLHIAGPADKRGARTPWLGRLSPRSRVLALLGACLALAAAVGIVAALWE